MDLRKDEVVLHKDVVLIPVSALPREVTRTLKGRRSDVAITRVHGRAPSRLIEARAAAFLKRFLRPRTVLDAVLAHSKAAKLDPAQLLEDAYPLVQLLLQSDVLVPKGAAALSVTPSLDVDQIVHGYRILRCVHLLDDVEVYMARHPRSGLAALKIGRRGLSMEQPLLREASILRELRGALSPRLLRTGRWRKRPYIAMQWCAGQPIDSTASELRSGGEEDHHRLLNLCARMIEAFAVVHSKGVWHGDIHDRNVLADEHETVHIIDFGVASSLSANRRFGSVSRVGLNFFQDPQLAMSYQSNSDEPPLSSSAEQYAVAALAYLCLTGEHYVKFGLDTPTVIRQIAESEPLPLVTRGMRPSPRLEACLRRALEKQPRRRFRSMAAFGRAFRAAIAADQRTARETRQTPVGRGGSAAYLKSLLQRLDSTGPVYRLDSLPAPTASVSFGSAGIAYALYRIACATRSPRLLAEADLWFHRALSGMSEPNAFEDGRELSADVVGRVSPYHTVTGVFSVEALIAEALDDGFRANAAVESYCRRVTAPCGNPDLTLGTTGGLLGSALLLETIRSLRPSTARLLTQTGNGLMRRLWRRAGAFSASRRSIFECLGMAHGWAGLIYASLRWSAVSGSPVPVELWPSAHHLATLAVAKGDGLWWPMEAGKPDSGYMTGWCHGVAGYVHLWTEAHRAQGERRWLDLAHGAAETVWAEPQSIGHLCCGVAGQAYALLALHQHTGDTVWKRRATLLAQRAVKLPSPPQSINSLYKGDIGVGILVAELERPQEACMPFFGREVR